MKKQIISLMVAMTLLTTLVPNLFGITASADTPITRAEWIHELVVLFDMTVEQDNMPDDFFTDITTASPYYRDVMVATEFGVIDIEAGYPFDPKSPVTREFAAQTMNFCLGFIPAEDAIYPFSDVDDIAYPNDAFIAVERDWFSLNAGKFSPELSVTEAEMNVIFADAAVVWTGTEIDEGHDNAYQFESGIVEIPLGVDASEDENGAVTIIDSPKSISNGQTFIVYFNELPKAYVAQSVVVSGSITTITTNEKNIDEVTVEADAQGIVTADLSLAEPIDDTIVTFIPDDIQPFARGGGSVKIPGSLDIKRDIPLGNGSKVSISAKMSKMEVEYKYTTKDWYAYIGIKGETDFKVSGSFDFWEAGGHPKKIELAKIPVAGVGNVTVAMEYSISGSISLVYTCDTRAGLEFSQSGGFRVVGEFKKKSFSLDTELKLTAGLELSLGFDIVALKGSLYAKAGAEIKQTTKTYNDGIQPNTCIHQVGFLFAKIGAKASVDVIVYKDTYTYNIDIFTEKNSPVRTVHHFENNRLVPCCTRDKSDPDFYGNGYYTSINSNYRPITGGSGISGDWRTGTGTVEPAFTYTVSDNKATITGVTSIATALVIPAELDGYPVVAIGNAAFRNKKTLKSAVIPDSITEISQSAFENCTALTSTPTMNGVTKMGGNVFKGCASLTNAQIPRSLTPDNIIGGIFENCTSLTSAFIPQNIMQDGANMSNYARYWFRGCTKLTTITIEEGSTLIPSNAFRYSPALTTVIIPDSTTYVGQYAFANCTALKSTPTMNCVTQMGSGVFLGCTSLTNAQIPRTLTSNNTMFHIFYGCTSLTSIFIPKNVMQVGAEMNNVARSWFRDCTKLTTITIEEGSTLIPSNAFSDSPALTTAIIPDSVERIGQSAFARCPALTSTPIMNGVVQMGSSVFLGCTSLTNAQIPRTLTSNNTMFHIFYGCTSLTSIFIPKNVMQVGAEMSNVARSWFQDCTKLTTITIEEGSMLIPSNAFSNSPALTTAIIPDSVERIGQNAFRDSTSLTNIYFWGDAPTFESSALPNLSTITAYYPTNAMCWEPIKSTYNQINWLTWDVNEPLTTTTYQTVQSQIGLQFTVKPSKVERPLNNGEILLAIYEKPSGKLLFITKKSCDGRSSYTLDTPLHSNVTAKVFVWNSVAQMEPAGNVEIINIPQME